MRGGAQQWLQPRGGAPPEGEKGGAGRPGSHPGAMTLARGARRTPCSAASDGRLALGWPIHLALRGIGERLRRDPHPLVLERASRESPAPSPPSPGLEVRGAGARTVYPPCRARYRTAAPGSCAETRSCRRTAISSPRPGHHATCGRPQSSSAYIHNEPLFTIPADLPACRVDAADRSPTALPLPPRHNP